jgi:hypothetical protein
MLLMVRHYFDESFVNRVIYRFVILHLIIFSYDYFFGLEDVRTLLTFVENSNPKPRGFFSEHSWSALVLSQAPFVIRRRWLRVIVYVLVLFWLSKLDSATGFLGFFVTFLFTVHSRIQTFNPWIKTSALLIIVVVVSMVFSYRFSVDYNMSNATRILIPFYLFHGFLDNPIFGLGLDNGLLYLIQYHSYDLTLLNEFRNYLEDEAGGRFNSFNLFLRLTVAYGILGLIFSSFLVRRLFGSSNKVLLCLALLTALSNDSFNNIYLFLVFLI